MRNRKTREVYYKNRKRKVDQDKESNDHQRNFIEDEDNSEYADPQPQEPKEYNNFISSPANDSVSTSNANMVNAVKENFITNEHSNQSSFLRNDKMSKQSIQDASMAKGTINETLNEVKLAPRKIPSKKQSSDKRRRIVNTRQNLITGSSENADQKSTHPMVSSPPLNPQKRPLSKTGLITDLHMPPQNAAIIGMKLVEKPSNDRDPTSILPTKPHPDTISNLYIKAVTQNAAGGQRQEVDLDRPEWKEENSDFTRNNFKNTNVNLASFLNKRKVEQAEDIVERQLSEIENLFERRALPKQKPSQAELTNEGLNLSSSDGLTSKISSVSKAYSRKKKILKRSLFQ